MKADATPRKKPTVIKTSFTCDRPTWLELNRQAQEASRSRSGYIQHLIKEKIKQKAA